MCLDQLVPPQQVCTTPNAKACSRCGAYLAQLVGVDDTVVGEVETQLVGEHDGALLIHMVAQDAPTQHNAVWR